MVIQFGKTQAVNLYFQQPQISVSPEQEGRNESAREYHNFDT